MGHWEGGACVGCWLIDSQAFLTCNMSRVTDNHNTVSRRLKQNTGSEHLRRKGLRRTEKKTTKNSQQPFIKLCQQELIKSTYNMLGIAEEKNEETIRKKGKTH